MELGAKINSNRYLGAIKDSFTSIVSLIIVGSIGTLLGSVVCNSTTGLAQYSAFSWLASLAPIFTTINAATTNMISLFVAFYIGYYLAKSYGHDGIIEGMVSLASLICAAPTVVSLTVGEKTSTVNALSTDITASKGLFVAMLVGILATTAFIKLCNVEKLKIHMPDSVPPNVAKSFSSLVPITIVLISVSLISFLFRMAFNMYLSEAIYKVLAVPVQAAFQNPIGIILCAFIAAIFWICGIHGASIVTGVTDAITIAAVEKNAELVAGGQAATEIVTRPFWSMYITMGGFGCTIALIIAILIVSKRDDYRAIAKLSIAPSIFGINEPVIFGLPIVMNPILGIPFVIAPCVSALIGYIATAVGFAGKAYIMIP
jgi:PTS system, lactose/cellobiose family IIC component